MSKWRINLLSFLALQGGGQRPQAHSQLQLPRAEELDDLSSTAGVEGAFELQTAVEKTPRALDSPSVIFPKAALIYVKFHANVIRPVIIECCRVTEEENQERALLLRAKSGESLDSSRVTKTLRRFLTSIDPELKNAATMTIRGSFATMMLQRCRENKIFKEKTEEQLLELLGKMMSASVEQLVSACASNGEKILEALRCKCR